MIKIVGLNDQFTLRNHMTTIRAELDGADRDNIRLFQSKNLPERDKYQVVFSKLPGVMSDTRAWGVSKVDFDYLREQGIPNAFGRS